MKGVNDAISSLQTSSNGKVTICYSICCLFVYRINFLLAFYHYKYFQNNTNGNYGSISNITASLAKVLERRSTPKTTWQSQSSGPIELQPVIDALSAILAFLIFTDTLYRVVITLKYFKNYWSRSIVDIPKVDLRQHSTADRIYEVVVAVEKAMHMMPFLLIQLALVIMLLAVTYAIAMYAYLPEYNSYVANCVRNEKGLNGTYLSKFVHQYAYDYAALDGNGAMVSGIARYNKKAAIQCSTAYGSSIQSLNDILTSISNANSSVQVISSFILSLKFISLTII